MLSKWSSSCTRISQRWVFAIMAFLGLWLGNGLRVALSITITEMTVPIAEATHQLDDTCATIEKPVLKNVTTTDTDYLYDWDEYTQSFLHSLQGIVLSSYFVGYVIMHFPAGFLSERYGGKHFLGMSVIVPSVLTFFTPMGLKYGGATALTIMRSLMGLAGGAMYPAVSAMLPRWSAPIERTKFGSFVYSGGMFGTVCGNTIAALIISYSGSGWPAVFYIFGAVGMLWFPLWMVLCYNSPKKHPFISETELKYLQETSERKQKPPPAPYGHIFRSMPMWAFVTALFGVDWIYFTMATDLPKYMSSVVKFSIEDNGYLSSLPHLGGWMSSICSFWILDYIVGRKWLKLGSTRKLMAVVSLIGPAIFVLGASYAECDQVMVVMMFVVGVTLLGASYPAIVVNSMDLSPNYSGTLMAIGNSFAALGGIFTPYVVGILTPNQTIAEWRIAFWIVFATAVLSCMFFLVFGSVEVQPWNDPDFLKNEGKKRDLEST
ncbi:sialin-like [Copidosoma floridanum]|uniref:sialin-like n=1 Tax=Copidosoma floridanum TaxID=29053 RepID=UPI000C6F52A1|nr:sialin-like [Copidosoma floridanum]